MAVQTRPAQADVAVLTHFKFTRDQYYRLGEAGILSEDDRVELIGGEIIEMAAVGPRHQHAVDSIHEQLIEQIGRRGRIRGQGPFWPTDDTELMPDLAVTVRQDYIDRHPGPQDVLLAIEVADTSLRYDLTIKLPIYAAARVPQLWIVDLTHDRLLQFTEPSGDSYRTRREHRPSDTLTTEILPGLATRVTSAEVFRHPADHSGAAQ